MQTATTSTPLTTVFTPGRLEHERLGPLASRLVPANDMPWQPIRYPAC